MAVEAHYIYYNTGVHEESPLGEVGQRHPHCGSTCLTAAINDTDYLNSTWETTPKFRASLCEGILKAFPAWKIYGKDWSSWLWIDTGSETAAKQAVDSCKALGVPIRWGKYGYECPTYIRIGVRDQVYHEPLFSALKAASSH